MNSETSWRGVSGRQALVDARPSAWIAAVPTICAVHCVVTPVLVSTLPFFAATHALEAWLLGASALVVAASLRASWRLHGRPMVGAVAAAGLGVWSLSAAGWLAPLPEAATSPLGGLLVGVALVWNGRLRHQGACGQCSCPAHGD